jgi:hypothetical protein
MAAIKLEGLSLPEAEEALSEVWCCLEEYGIPSPRMEVDLRANARIGMEFSFDEPVWADLVSMRLSDWLRSSALAERGSKLVETAPLLGSARSRPSGADIIPGAGWAISSGAVTMTRPGWVRLGKR